MIAEAFDRETVKRLADPEVFARGEAYARLGHVEIVGSTSTRRIADVVGIET